MNILLTSNKGFIGTYFKNHLTKLGYDVFAEDKAILDIRNTKSLSDYIDINKIDVIIHNAIKGGRRTVIDNDDIISDNIIMAKNVMMQSGKVHKIINLCSGAVYDRRRDIYDYTEDQFGRSIPIDKYGFSKFMIAKEMKQIKAYNLRIFNCFGPHESNDRFIKSNLLRKIHNLPLHFIQNRYMDFFSIYDLLTVINHIVNHRCLSYDINMSYGTKYTLSDVLNMINALDSNKQSIESETDMFTLSYCGSHFTLADLGLPLLGLDQSIGILFKELS